jgi:large subunit ribosomal protein L18e
MTTTNTQLAELISDLKKAGSQNESDLWKRIAYDLEKPTRQRRIVNLSKISRYCSEDEVIVVPGKVLGSGELNKKLTIAAYQFSDQAKEKIKEAKGTSIGIAELIKKNPKGKKVRIIG